jgi:hypothetical protein
MSSFPKVRAGYEGSLSRARHICVRGGRGALRSNDGSALAAADKPGIAPRFPDIPDPKTLTRMVFPLLGRRPTW